jgi:DNA-binding MarR family transcriptional regulator
VVRRGNQVVGRSGSEEGAQVIDLSSIPTGGCNVTAVRKASRRLTQLYDEALMPSGVRSTQYSILAELSHRPGGAPTMRELADALVMDRSALGHSVRPLLRDGFLQLVEDEADRRVKNVVLTPLGKEKYAEARRLWQIAQDRFSEVVGEAESAEFRAILLNVAHEERLASLTDE